LRQAIPSTALKALANASFSQALHKKQQGIEHVARGVQPQLMVLRRPPRQPLGHLVVVEGIGRARRDLNGDRLQSNEDVMA
jgi:hypothetical protein